MTNLYDKQKKSKSKMHLCIHRQVLQRQWNNGVMDGNNTKLTARKARTLEYQSRGEFIGWELQ